MIGSIVLLPGGSYIPLLVIVVFFLVKTLLNHIKKPQNLPPGPSQLPMFGNFLSLPRDKPLHKFLQDLSKTYGDVFHVKLGVQNMIILNSAAAIEEAFKRSELAGRPKNSFAMTIVRKAREDLITCADGPRWQMGRKGGILSLSHLGLSKNSLVQESFQRGVDWLLGKLEESEGQPVTTSALLFPCLASILSSLCFGSVEDPDDEYFKDIYQTGEDFQNSAALAILDSFPYLQFLFHGELGRLQSRFSAMIGGMLDKVDEYLSEQKSDKIIDLATSVEVTIKAITQDEKAKIPISDHELRRIVGELFNAGFFTSAENLTWALLFLAKNPETQHKLAEEIVSHVGNNRLPGMIEDLPNLHYTKATFYEVLRRGSNVAFALPHRAIKETEFRGYTVPKDFTILANVWAAHHDPVSFPDPFVFNPERFVDGNGQFSKSAASKVLAFSTGKRRCIGEKLAVQTVPFVLSAIVQKFSFTLAGQIGQDPVENPIGSFTIGPGHHHIVFKKREFM